MKKIVSILLALALILSLSTTAFATTLTIADDAAVPRTYNGYQLLTLTTSLKCTCAEGATHTDDCYNYAYSVNDKYESILQAQAGAGNDILDYLSDQTGDDEGGTLRGVADRIYRAIQAADIDADAASLTTTTEIAQGYWLFADVTGLDGQNEANSLVVLDTKGQGSLTITPKTGLPTLVKKVKDINDSTTAESDWQDSADHDINDAVQFQLTATLPKNLAYYEEYAIIFHDTLSAGLTLDVSSIKVFAGDVEVTDKFIRPETATSTFEISCGNILAIDGVNKDTVFVVTYSATLNENAVIGSDGNPNTAYLEFSNNPYDEGTGKTKDDTVIVYTYQLTIHKVDSQNQPLPGAGFTLYKKSADGTYTPIGGELKLDKDNKELTTFSWKGLDDGDYKLEETTVPDGYNKMADKEFTITADHEAEEKTLSGGNFGSGDFALGTITDDIVNNTGIELPETGAKGTMMLITISTLFIMVAAVFMITRKKMSIYED